MQHHDQPEQPDERKKFEIEETILDPYAVLGLERSATPEAIKKAYFAMVRQYPPERDPANFKRIRAAYDMLRTPEAKAATDLFMLHPPLSYEPYKRPPTFNVGFDADDWLDATRTQSDIGRDDFRADFRDIDL